LVSIFLPAWPLLGAYWHWKGGGWMATAIISESLLLWVYVIYVRVIIARKMEISPWYAFTTPLGAGVFGAMMFTSAWKVISRKGVTWKGRIYASE